MHPDAIFLRDMVSAVYGGNRTNQMKIEAFYCITNSVGALVAGLASPIVQSNGQYLYFGELFFTNTSDDSSKNTCAPQLYDYAQTALTSFEIGSNLPYPAFNMNTGYSVKCLFNWLTFALTTDAKLSFTGYRVKVK